MNNTPVVTIQKKLRFICGHCDAVNDELYSLEPDIIEGRKCFSDIIYCHKCNGRNKVVEWSSNLKYGCHCDLLPGEKPDDCVLDISTRSDCIHATNIKSKEECLYWREIE